MICIGTNLAPSQPHHQNGNLTNAQDSKWAVISINHNLKMLWTEGVSLDFFTEQILHNMKVVRDFDKTKVALPAVGNQGTPPWLDQTYESNRSSKVIVSNHVSTGAYFASQKNRNPPDPYSGSSLDLSDNDSTNEWFP